MLIHGDIHSLLNQVCWFIKKNPNPSFSNLVFSFPLNVFTLYSPQIHAGFILHLKLVYLWQHKYQKLPAILHSHSSTPSTPVLWSYWGLHSLIYFYPSALSFFSLISSFIWFGEILLSTSCSCLHADLLSGQYIHHHLSPYFSNICCIPTSSHGPYAINCWL